MRRVAAMIPFFLLYALIGCRPSSPFLAPTEMLTRAFTQTNNLFTPTRSPTQFPSLTPSRPYPVWEGTSIPATALVLDPDTASRIVELARWMRGWAFQALYSPDGRFLAVGSEIGIYLYDAVSLDLVRVIEPPSPADLPDRPRDPDSSQPFEFTGFAFSPDGKLLATDAGYFMLIWEVETGRRLRTFAMGQGDHGSVTFSPDGKRLAVGLQFNVTIWDIATGAETTLDMRIYFHAWVAFSPDGSMLAAANIEGEIAVWDFAKGRVRYFSDKEEESVLSLAFSPDGGTLAAGFEDGTIRLWEVSSGKRTGTLISHEAAVDSIAFSPNGAVLASASDDGMMKIWNFSDRKLKYTRKLIKAGYAYGHYSKGLTVAFSPDGMLASTADDFTIRFWDPTTGEERGALRGSSTREISEAVFSPDGQTLATIAEGGTLRLWDVATGWEQDVKEKVIRAFYSRDGILIAAVGRGNPVVIDLVDIESGQVLGILDGDFHGIYDIALSPDGRTLAVASDGDTISLWDYATRRMIRGWKEQTYGVHRLVYSPDGRKIASTGERWGGVLTIWNAATGKALHTLTTPSEYGDNVVKGLAFSPDGKILASGSLFTITSWDVASGKILFTTDKAGDDPVDSVAFSPDGQILASGSNTIVLWETASGKRLSELTGHYFDGRLISTVIILSFSPDGTLLMSGSRDGTIRIWGVASSGNNLACIPEIFI